MNPCNGPTKGTVDHPIRCVALAAPGIDRCAIHAAADPLSYAKCDDCGAWCAVTGSELTGRSWRCVSGHLSTRNALTRAADREPIRREHL